MRGRRYTLRDAYESLLMELRRKADKSKALEDEVGYENKRLREIINELLSQAAKCHGCSIEVLPIMQKVGFKNETRRL